LLPVKATISILIALWILSGSLMPGNDMEELVKIPALLHHYQEHKAVHPGEVLSFSDFILEHYSQKPCDDSNHEDLPFFKHNLPCLIFLIPKIEVSAEKLPFCCLLPVIHSPEPPALLLSYCGQVWQPPKV
jgi:hypothetical protein